MRRKMPLVPGFGSCAMLAVAFTSRRKGRNKATKPNSITKGWICKSPCTEFNSKESSDVATKHSASSDTCAFAFLAKPCCSIGASPARLCLMDALIGQEVNRNNATIPSTLIKSDSGPFCILNSLLMCCKDRYFRCLT